MISMGIDNSLEVFGVGLESNSLYSTMKHDIVKKDITDPIKGNTYGHWCESKSTGYITEKKEQNCYAAKKDGKKSAKSILNLVAKANEPPTEGEPKKKKRRRRRRKKKTAETASATPTKSAKTPAKDTSNKAEAKKKTVTKNKKSSTDTLHIQGNDNKSDETVISLR